ncbi:right-handed parallel beta-helix repeat-containing protein [Fibrisoma montanum]|uniref:Right-handed parallel beta-helix repeat-containing protein n=2 Tax=Fibrisoma montanum TaxID=2305895 RepID=A0A418MJ08_9BACT|nr:right-handed parallel beta-helix repeat-containing protein [Fibrisoma montanum]
MMNRFRKTLPMNAFAALLLTLLLSNCKPAEDKPTAPAPTPQPGSSVFKPKFIIDKSGLHDGVAMGVKPGDTIGIKAGEYTFFRFRNFTGSEDKPIVFINYEGLVRVYSTEVNQSNVSFSSSRYFVLTGQGAANIPYGFKIGAPYKDVSALVIAGKSSDVDINRVEIDTAGFAGIMAKTDPAANDPTTWRGNFTMYNVKVHHNYVHDTRGEGLYIGNSFWNEGVNKTLFPHEIQGLEIHHNLIERAGCEGIQYACAANSSVHDNKVKTSGLSPFAAYQDNGVQIGGGVSGEFYNNEIDKARNIGLIIVGHRGPLNVYNNLITNSGTCGVFVDERANSVPGVSIKFTNVTVDGAGEDAFRFYNETQKNEVSKTVTRNYKRFLFDRSPKTVPLVESGNYDGTGAAPKGVGYQPSN